MKSLTEYIIENKKPVNEVLSDKKWNKEVFKEVGIMFNSVDDKRDTKIKLDTENLYLQVSNPVSGLYLIDGDHMDDFLFVCANGRKGSKNFKTVALVGPKESEKRMKEIQDDYKLLSHMDIEIECCEPKAIKWVVAKLSDKVKK